MIDIIVSDCLGLIGTDRIVCASTADSTATVLDAIHRAGRSPMPMPEWAAYYGWESCFRWFPTDAPTPGSPCDVPRPIAAYLPAVTVVWGQRQESVNPAILGTRCGIRRDISGCVDYRTREDATQALAVACVLWLRETNRGAARAEGKDDSVSVAHIARIAGD